MSEQIDAFLDAARCAGAVLGHPAIGAAWDQPSALARMSVGDVAGHLFLVVRRVDKHLDSVDSAPLGAPSRDIGGVATRLTTLRVGHPAELDDDVHARVRADSSHIARHGWEAVRDRYGERIDRLAAKLVHPPAEITPLGGSSPVALDSYLESRVTELVVHGDDLVASGGLDGWPVEPGPATMDVAIGFLVASGRARHGDLGIVRAFSRRERTPPGVPAVY